MNIRTNICDTLPDWLARCAENRPEHLAVQCEQVQWSFAELDRQATRLARQLASIGVQEGNRVALLAANGLPYVAFVHALTRLGAILVPLNLRLTPEELCWQVRDVRASLLVCDANYASLAHEIGRLVPQLPLATLANWSKRDETVLSQELDPLKGDELVSSLDRNSEDSHKSTALASPADTLGHPDKVPVLAQHAESAALSSTENVLPRHGILAWNPTVQLERNHAGELSLSGEPECLSLHEEYRTTARKSQASPPAGAARSSRSPEGDGPPEWNLSELPESDVPLLTLIDLGAPQAILYTSGTTGQPKGAIITYGMQWWNAVGSALNLGHSPDDRWLACLPLFHIGGLSILMRSVIYGISVMVHKQFDPLIANHAIFEDKITIISVVAVMLQRMLAALDTSKSGAGYPATLRCVLLGGGPVPYPLLEACMLRDIPVVQTYGLTEACSQAATLSPADAIRKPGSAGRPLPPVQLCIMYDNRPASAGEPGEIFLKGPTITPGYVDRPEATTQAFQDGWFATGDMGYLDKDGYLYVLDRRADLIISGGENVYPAEIESVLLSHPGIQEAGVCGQADPRWGQVPVAFVVLKAGSTVSAGELLGYTAQKLARYKQPQAIYFTEKLPHTSTGKLLRRELPCLLQTL